MVAGGPACGMPVVLVSGSQHKHRRCAGVEGVGSVPLEEARRTATQ